MTMITLSDGDVCPVCGDGMLQDPTGDGEILVCDECGVVLKEQ